MGQDPPLADFVTLKVKESGIHSQTDILANLSHSPNREMSKVLRHHIQQWCQEHGWTDMFIEQSQFWAFPPESVLPLPIPSDAIEAFYTSREMSLSLRLISMATVGIAFGAILLTVATLSPIPLLTAFGLCAISVATFEEEPI